MPTKTQTQKPKASILSRASFPYPLFRYSKNKRSLSKQMEETSSNINDPSIKLFGKKIHLPLGEEFPPLLKKEVLEGEERPNKDCPSGEVHKATQEDETPPSSDAEASSGAGTLTDNNANPKTDSTDEESMKLRNSKADKEQNDATNLQEKSIKKPDKILPCPRCNSMDTKFCYYNNYNVNQPRHFCKACQRYWTAGGSMRNVPVGAGRRKNKSSSLNYRNITISEALQAAGVDIPNGAHHPSLKTNGGVVSFGLDAPIRDSMASVMNLADKNVLNGTSNGFHGFQEKHNPGPCKVGEIGEDCLSTVTAASPMEEAVTNYPQELRGINGFASPIPCIPSVPWAPYPWNSPIASLPAFCQAGFPMPFCPATYWNCGMAGAWNIPLQSPQSSSSSNLKDKCSSPNSHALRKHSRDTDALKPEDSEIEEPTKHKNARVLVPKILRIDDPNDAAKSSIWTTLGIKTESCCREGLFKALQSKGDGKSCVAETSPVLWANPAALSRSIEFRESS